MKPRKIKNVEFVLESNGKISAILIQLKTLQDVLLKANDQQVGELIRKMYLELEETNRGARLEEIN